MTLLTINSFPYKYGLHAFNELISDNSALLCSCVLIKSVGDSDAFLYPMLIRHFFFQPAKRRRKVTIFFFFLFTKANDIFSSNFNILGAQ